MTDGLSASDVALLSGNNGRNNDNGFGDGNGWWIILFFLCMFGWGGFGGFGGGFGGNAAGLQGALTRADINEGFALNNLQSGITAIQQGICDSTYALANAVNSGFNSTQMGMMQGFNGVERGFCNLSSQLSDCCCQTQRAIDGVNYNMAKNTCDLQNTMNVNTRDIIDSQNAGTRAILDYLCQEKISDLQAENQTLKLAASQANQNATLMAAMDANTAQIIRRTGNDCPIPAYVVQPPAQVTFPTNCCGQFNGGGWGGNCNQCGNC